MNQYNTFNKEILHRSSRRFKRIAFHPKAGGMNSESMPRPPVSSVLAEMPATKKFLTEEPSTKKFLFSKCTDARCKTCLKISPDQVSIKRPIFCKVKNCVYLITCSTCQAKYVGQTSNVLSVRLNGHRSDIKLFKNKNDIELKHFQAHDFENITLKILDVEKKHFQ